MLLGCIKKWDQSKGWGFIEDEEGYDYFFNISNVRKGVKIKEGFNVKFDVFESSRGQEAENISIV